MDPIAQIILAFATLVTAVGTLILGIVNRGTLTTVAKQTDGMLAGMQEKAEALGHAHGKAEEIQYQRDNPPGAAVAATLKAEEPLEVKIVELPDLMGVTPPLTPKKP